MEGWFKYYEKKRKEILLNQNDFRLSEIPIKYKCQYLLNSIIKYWTWSF